MAIVLLNMIAYKKICCFAESKKYVVSEKMIKNIPATGQANYRQQVDITVVDMHRLVQSARVERSNSK